MAPENIDSDDENLHSFKSEGRYLYEMDLALVTPPEDSKPPTPPAGESADNNNCCDIL